LLFALSLAILSVSYEILGIDAVMTFDSHGPYTVVATLNVSLASDEAFFRYEISADTGSGFFRDLAITNISVDGRTWTSEMPKSGRRSVRLQIDRDRNNDSLCTLRYRLSTPVAGSRLNISLLYLVAPESSFRVTLPKPVDFWTTKVENAHGLRPVNCNWTSSDRNIDISCSKGDSGVWFVVPLSSFFFAPTTPGIVAFGFGVGVFLILFCVVVRLVVAINAGDAGTDLLPTELTQLLYGTLDPRQALLFLASTGRVTLTIDDESEAVSDIVPEEKDESGYRWILGRLTRVSGASKVIRDDRIISVMFDVWTRLEEDAKRSLVEKELIWREMFDRLPAMGVAIVLSCALGFIIEPAFATQYWTLPVIFAAIGFGTELIWMQSLSCWSGQIGSGTCWLGMIVLACFARWGGVGGLYLSRPCTWDMISGIVWAAVGDMVLILAMFIPTGWTMKGMREAGRGVKYLGQLAEMEETVSEAGPDLQRSLAYRGRWIIEGGGRRPWSVWKAWLLRGMCEQRARNPRKATGTSTITLPLT
jgi:hypothetical protein